MEARRLGLGAKRPRAEPEWKAREYGAWCDVEYWRQEEGRIYNRRPVWRECLARRLASHRFSAVRGDVAARPRGAAS